MPRRAKQDPDVERRVTRRSLQQSAPEPAAPVEEPKPRAARAAKASPKAAKASPTATKGGPARWKSARGRGRFRGRKAAKKEESSDEGEEELMNEESGGGDQPTEMSSTKADKEEETPVESEKEEEKKVEETPPSSGRRTRGSPRAPAPKTPPSRRSGRGAAKIAAEKIGEQAAGEEPAAKEEEGGELTSPGRRGRKRKSVDMAGGSPVKKQKTVEVDVSEGKTEEAMDTEEREKAIDESKAAETKQDVEMKPAEPTAMEPAQPQEEAVGKTVEPQQQAAVEPAAEPQEDAKMEPAAPEEEAKPAEVVEPEGGAAGPAPTATSDGSQEATKDLLKDFVVVDKAEVPASDSPAIVAALPKHPQQPGTQASPQAPNTEAPRPVPAVVVTAPEAPTPEVSALAAPVKAPIAQAPVAPVVQAPVAPVVQAPVVQAPVVQAPVIQPPVVQAPLAPVQQETVAPTNVSSNGDTSNTSQQLAAPVAPVNSNHTATGSVPVSNNLGAPPQAHDNLFTREFVANKSLGGAMDVARQFSVVSYNVLAECLALRCAKEGSYSWLSADNLLTEARSKRLLQELAFLDADIVCLQEVGKDFFTGTLQPAFQTLGYEGVFIKRNDLTTDDGEATFFRTSQFKLIHSHGVVLSQLAFSELEKSSLDDVVKKSVRSAIESPAVAMLTQLQSKTTGKVLCVANIHVSYERFQRPDLQCVQAACAIKELVSVAGGADRPHIICGDFNSMPTSPVYQLTREGYLNDLSMAKLQALPSVQMADGQIMALVNLWWHIFQHTSNNMRSAYDTVLGCEPATSKSVHDGAPRSLDYLWYASSSLHVIGVLRTPSEALIQQGIPNATFPSDHVSIKAVFAFK